MYVIGTAGHVDHGKSTLVQALSGINPDRLAEEQRREMTIDLGFAWLELPSGREISIVDVPGHEDFVKNMLAGVGGIDAAILVVAADEGVMPQTREHLAILDLLDVTRGVVALTKADLVEDEEWLELVVDDLREELAETALRGAKIVPVSAVAGRGLDNLLCSLDTLLDDTPEPADLGKPRLPIDRVFTISGFGTVVTGTLVGGRLNLGSEMQVSPGDMSVRIRGLQSHKTKVETALPGTRVAVNVTGVDARALRRGHVLCLPGTVFETGLVDAQLRMTADAPLSLKHNAEVYLHTGAESVLARCRLLDSEALEPGQTGWVQFRLERPIACARNDRYVIRLASPSYTMGGGKIVEPMPMRRHKRMRDDVIHRLEVLAHGSPADIMRMTLQSQILTVADQAIAQSGLERGQAISALNALDAAGELHLFGDRDFSQLSVALRTQLLLDETWVQLQKDIRQALTEFHAANPLRAGMSREDLRSRLAGAQGSVDLVAYAAEKGVVRLMGTIAALPDYAVELDPGQEQRIERAMAEFAGVRMPPSFGHLQEAAGNDLAQLMIDRGQIVRLSDEVVYAGDEYAAMRDKLVEHLRGAQTVTVAQARDLLGISRKLALALLEYMDRQRITKRVGDLRLLR